METHWDHYGTPLELGDTVVMVQTPLQAHSPILMGTITKNDVQGEVRVTVTTPEGTKWNSDRIDSTTVKVYSAEDVKKAKLGVAKQFAEQLKEKPIKYSLPLLGLSTKEEIEAYFCDIMLNVGKAVDEVLTEIEGELS